MHSIPTAYLLGAFAIAAWAPLGLSQDALCARVYDNRLTPIKSPAPLLADHRG